MVPHGMFNVKEDLTWRLKKEMSMKCSFCFGQVMGPGLTESGLWLCRHVCGHFFQTSLYSQHLERETKEVS